MSKDELANDKRSVRKDGDSEPLTTQLKWRIKYAFYRPFMRLIHRYGFHYAPKRYPPEPSSPIQSLPGSKTIEWHHWCQWCGLRGKTLQVEWVGSETPTDERTLNHAGASPK